MSRRSVFRPGAVRMKQPPARRDPVSAMGVHRRSPTRILAISPSRTARQSLSTSTLPLPSQWTLPQAQSRWPCAASPTSSHPSRENYSSTRHHLGIYRCVVVTCRYRLLSSPRLSPPTLDAFAAAVACVVAAQPMLRVGILDQHTSHAARFSHVPRVDLRRHLSWDRLPAGPGYEARLAERQAWHHDQLWTDIETRPPWRVQVLRPGSDSCSGSGPDSAPFYDVLFAFHHALMDGSAGKAFHQHLLAALNLSPSSPSSSSPSSSSPSSSPPSSSSDPYLLSFPDPPTLPEAQEDVIPFTNSIPFLVSTVLRDLGPAILRPWLMGLRMTRLGVLGPSASPSSFDTPFAASTPISLRPYLSAAADPALRPLLRNLVTGYTCHFSALQAAALCAAAAPTLAQNSDDDAALDALIWETARRVRRDLAARLATLPADDSSPSRASSSQTAPWSPARRSA
ncbi:hypothetical protein HIM_09696 [Hirsutella minnesotensis 3608]|uniref:Uncharacterized protein n=1 Tax=Hirsutella minnesotensis 3608 TaxID=1043627 RepID=A0A0F7ZS81_9HYPO|nr:hypothetical protein HIM_09696 [Hirsutella minnesotensis 3608]